MATVRDSLDIVTRNERVKATLIDWLGQLSRLIVHERIALRTLIACQESHGEEWGEQEKPPLGCLSET